MNHVVNKFMREARDKIAERQKDFESAPSVKRPIASNIPTANFASLISTEVSNLNNRKLDPYEPPAKRSKSSQSDHDGSVSGASRPMTPMSTDGSDRQSEDESNPANTTAATTSSAAATTVGSSAASPQKRYFEISPASPPSDHLYESLRSYYQEESFGQHKFYDYEEAQISKSEDLKIDTFVWNDRLQLQEEEDSLQEQSRNSDPSCSKNRSRHNSKLDKINAKRQQNARYEEYYQRIKKSTYSTAKSSKWERYVSADADNPVYYREDNLDQFLGLTSNKAKQDSTRRGVNSQIGEKSQVLQISGRNR